MNDAIARSTEEQTEVSGVMVNHVEDIQRCADEASNASVESMPPVGRGGQENSGHAAGVPSCVSPPVPSPCQVRSG